MGLHDSQGPLCHAHVVEKHTFIEVESDDDNDGSAQVFRRRPRALSDSLIELPCFDFVKNDPADTDSCGCVCNDNCSTCSDVTDWSMSREDAGFSEPISSRPESDCEENDSMQVPHAGQTTELSSMEKDVVDHAFTTHAHVPYTVGSPFEATPLAVDYVMMMAPMSRCFPPPGVWITPQHMPESGGMAEAEINKTHQPTTVILRNLPKGCLLSKVLEALDMEGFGSYYNFVHVPVDFLTKASMQYAVVNLIDHATAMQFIEHFQGFSKWAVPSDISGMECTVEWNETQGLETHIAKYRNSRLMHWTVSPEFRPALFNNGVQISFPPPTMRIKAPRMRPHRPAARYQDVHT